MLLAKVTPGNPSIVSSPSKQGNVNAILEFFLLYYEVSKDIHFEEDRFNDHDYINYYEHHAWISSSPFKAAILGKSKTAFFCYFSGLSDNLLNSRATVNARLESAEHSSRNCMDLQRWRESI